MIMLKKIVSVCVLLLLVGAGVLWYQCGREPFFRTRGVVVFWDDVKDPERLDWLEMAERAGLNTISVYAGAETKASEPYQTFVRQCGERGIAVEYQEHAMFQLLPRSLFAEHPEYFRMDKEGQRQQTFNCCVSSEEALEIIAKNARERALKERPTNHRYYFWLDDGGECCCCPDCNRYNDSDQALIIENRILEAVREVDPEAMVAHLCYHNTLKAPATVKPEEGVFLEFAPFYRSWDAPLSQPEAQREGMALTHADYMEALKENLKVFPAETTVVLEYWMDVSLFSGWKKPAVKLPWNRDVFLSDLRTYAGLGIRHITCYAAYVGADYLDLHGDVSFVEEYGRGLMEFKK